MRKRERKPKNVYVNALSKIEEHGVEKNFHFFVFKKSHCLQQHCITQHTTMSAAVLPKTTGISGHFVITY